MRSERRDDGLGTEYLSEEWMAILRRIVAVAGEIGMGVWFQAGHMPNGIPDLPEHLEAKALVAFRRAEPPEPGDRTVAERGETVYVERRGHHVLHDLSGARIGRMGHVLEAMLEMHTDPTALTAHFGVHVVQTEPDEVLAQGRSVRGLIPPTGNTNTRGFFRPDPVTFLKRWLAEGPTHHFALGVGHHAGTIAKVADCLGIDGVIVSPEA